MMGVTRKIINWCDNKYDEAVREDSGRKAFISGVVEGFVDGAIVLYIPVCIAKYIWKKKALEK